MVPIPGGSSGNLLGYADPKTLLGGPEKAYPTGALEEFKPSLMAGVPKVWETIKAGAQLKVATVGTGSRAGSAGQQHGPTTHVRGRRTAALQGHGAATLAGAHPHVAAQAAGRITSRDLDAASLRAVGRRLA